MHCNLPSSAFVISLFGIKTTQAFFAPGDVVVVVVVVVVV
jgi:hypothetical protein